MPEEPARALNALDEGDESIFLEEVHENGDEKKSTHRAHWKKVKSEQWQDGHQQVEHHT